MAIALHNGYNYPDMISIDFPRGIHDIVSITKNSLLIQRWYKRMEPS